ncbi:twin-arginine translocation signal domain-containing protein [Halobacterium jilantaiense]|uniref:Uncharacterized protein n=1 Tax=Halobacterium jilantaiense TaxID=355548 RepID=A0A1I0NBP1_9EURY|nr:twin-arginine translocation signal domain-containing protein [Halobacterium jilantaiense]SEV98471.1 hypothetical protein SAMN04487945_0739 [Halobacterium jilantaiense]
MPSRRTFLRAAGVGVPVALAGCLDSRERVEGYVQLKTIQARETESSESAYDTIIDIEATYENDTGPELTRLEEDWAAHFPVPRKPTVSDALHETLTDQFESVRYIVGVTSPGWADDGESVGSFNVATTRENFNRVQVHSAVTVSSDGTSLTVHSVDGVWDFDAADG